MTDVTIPEGVASIGDHAFFKCGGLKSVTIPASIKSIGKYAFSGCEGLTDVTIPGSVTNICDGVFSKCSGLTGVTIPEGVTDIGSYTFDECRNITSLTIPEGVKRIGDGAFYDCIALSSIELPSSLEKIGDRAFSGCTSLGSVIYKGSDDEWERIQIGNGNECLNVYVSKIIRVTGIAFDKNTITLDAGNSAVLTVTVTPDTASDKSVTWESSDEAVVSVDGGIVTANASGVAEIIAVTNDGAYSAKCKVVVRGKHTASESDLEYEIKNGSAIIISYFGQDSGEMEIPDTLDGYPVTIIGDNAFGEDDEHAYPKDSLVSVKKIILPQTLKEIGKKAFSRCENLSEINIPESLEYIGQKAFYETALYENDELWENGGFYVDNILIKVSARPEGCFYVREGTRGVASNAFTGSGVTEVVLPDSIYNLYSYAFDDSDVTAVNIPSGMKTINDYAFANSKITSISIPDSVESIGRGAFYECANLMEISVPNHITGIRSYAFTESGLTYAGIENENVILGEDVFLGCNNLENITMPLAVIKKIDKNVLRNSVKCITLTSDDPIDDYMFYNCHNLQEIYILDGVTSIGNYAFSGCENLRSVNLPGELINIGYRAFADCTKIRKINLPNGLVSISDEVFSGCTDLTEIMIPNSVERIGHGALYNTEIYNNSGHWENGVLYVGNILIEASSNINNAYIIDNGTRLIANHAFANIEKLNYVTIPDSVTDIGYGAFYNCINLRRAVVSANAKGIGHEVFSGCTSLGTVNIPYSVKYIGSHAFSGCTDLLEIVIPDSVTEIGAYAFSECGLGVLKIPGSVINIEDSAFENCCDLTKIIMYNGIKNIGNFVFFNCANLSEVSIPGSIIKMGNRAFDVCDKLNNIVFYGTVTKWNKIDMGYGNDIFSSNSITYAVSIPVAGITFNQNKLTLNTGETLALVAVVTPDNATDKSMAWRSSNEAVATVNGGVITAKAPGKAEITAVTNDGAYSAKCIVTVKEAIDEDTPIIKAESAKGKAGQTVDVKIMVKNNPGAALMSFELNYDKNAMTLKNATLGEIFTGDLDCNLNRVPFVFTVYAGQGNKTNDGLLVTLTFEIAEDCAEGEYALEISAIDCLNLDEEAVNYVPVNGKITVNNVIPGDVTGDGEVTRSDLLRLAKYFSGFEVEIDSAAADVTGDGEVTRSDLLRLAKYFSGFDVKLGQ